jgi:small subunit ribosomal protein S1
VDTLSAPTATAVEAISIAPDIESTGAEAAIAEAAIAETAIAETELAFPAPLAAPGKKIPLPNIRGALSADLEQEFQAAFADVPLDTLMSGSEAAAAQAPLEPESRHTARVVAVGREDVFLELGGRDQAVIPLKVFPEPPQVGAVFEIVIVRYNQEDGFYEASLPMAAAEIGDWSQIAEGMLVEARVTGHNSGGLECEVNRLRGFIPVSQISLYRVENLEEFVGQKLTCLVTEANPHRRNLVLSRRAVLEREREEARRAILESLAPGQVREGVVRKILDFGAFVDLGSGVDGLLHVSQLGWGRVKHPSEVVQEGQKIRVRVDKVDPVSKKISLSYKDLLDNPWNDADRKYMPNTVVRGKVVKIMEFGAFVELEPGVEGLVHISELSHKRVAKVSDVVKEGDEIEAMVLSVDAKAQRISLSMKNVHPPAEAETPPATPAAPAAEPPKPKPTKQPTQPLLGGLGRSPKGAKFGLKW